mgnify:CR=1 FL=1
MSLFSHEDYSDMSFSIKEGEKDGEFYKSLSCTMSVIFDFLTSEGTRQNQYVEGCLDINPSEFAVEFEKLKKLAKEHYLNMAQWYRELQMFDKARYREEIAKDIEKAFIKSVDVLRLRDKIPLNIYIYRIEKLDSLTRYYAILIEELKLKNLDGNYSEDNLVVEHRKMVLISFVLGSFFSIYDFLLKYLEREYSL